jgi:hypothetical protein
MFSVLETDHIRAPFHERSSDILYISRLKRKEGVLSLEVIGGGEESAKKSPEWRIRPPDVGEFIAGSGGFRPSPVNGRIPLQKETQILKTPDFSGMTLPRRGLEEPSALEMTIPGIMPGLRLTGRGIKWLWKFISGWFECVR